MAYRKEYLDALVLLSRAFDIAAAQGAARPVIVGGSAVEFYTGGAIASGDVDLVTASDEVVADALTQVGFRREDRRGHILRGFYHADVLIGVEVVASSLFQGRTDQTRLQMVVVDEAEGATVVFPPVEDMIADRLAQYENDRKARQDMLRQAQVLVQLAQELDIDYLMKRAREECVDPALIEALLSERSYE